jgi:hypothetical protein
MIKNGDRIYKNSSSELKYYGYEKHTSKEEPKDQKSKPQELTAAQKQEIVTKMLAAAAKPNSANRPYGTGDTIHSAEVAAARVGQVKIEGSNGYVAGETVFLEARARTYKKNNAVGAEAQASLMRAEYGAKGSASLVNFGQAEIIGVGGYAKGEGFVGAQGNVEAGAGFKGIIPYAGASAAVFAGARVTVGAGAELRVVGAGVRLDGNAYAWAGAQGSAEVSVAPTGIKAGVEGFAGAAAGASGTASVAGIGVTGNATAYAGIGGKAEVAFGLTGDGEITISAEAGGAVGVGAGAGLEVSIDTDQLMKDGVAVFNTVGQIATEIGDGMAQGANAAAGVANSVAQTVADGVQEAGEVAEDTAEAAGNVVSETAGQAVDAGEDVVDAVTDWLGF